MIKLSVAIPTFEYGGSGVDVLEYSFEKMKIQTFKDFEVIISDHSKNDRIKNLCDKWDRMLDIKYHKNDIDRGSGASNFNNAISHSQGEWIKLLCQDDFLFDEFSLETTIRNTADNINWLASAYWHSYHRTDFVKPHLPSINDQIYVINTIGSPSGVTIRNVDDMPLFDRDLQYCYDCDFYYRFWLKYGNPFIIREPTVVNYLWNESSTSQTTQQLIQIETLTILNKYGKL